MVNRTDIGDEGSARLFRRLPILTVQDICGAAGRLRGGVVARRRPLQ